MTWAYGKNSLENRDTCHPKLINVIDYGLHLSPVDIAIVWGWRDEVTQNGMFRSGVSQKQWPDSLHNHVIEGVHPQSLAFDFGPYVKGVAIPWEDTHMFALVAGIFFAAAEDQGTTLRWGGDWDMDGLTTDQDFMDWGHLELVGESA
jgi:peptidoglycan L-alanyl-D-glutamate endopeptidase CwlK